MARVREATTCAQAVLEANANNCGAVTDAHLDAVVRLMVDGSARYSWYIDFLLSLARGLPDADTSAALKIVHKLLAPANGYLLVLYSGASGRGRTTARPAPTGCSRSRSRPSPGRRSRSPRRSDPSRLPPAARSTTRR